MAATSTAATTPATAVEPKPLFPAEPVKYLRIETEDGHLFMVDEEACRRVSSTLRAMLEAQAALDCIGDLEKPTDSAIKIEDFSSTALDGVFDYIYWRKRWINVMVEKIQHWPMPRGNQPLIREMVTASHFLGV